MAKGKRQEVKEKIDEEKVLLKSQLARALADYDNLRKRVEAEKLGWEVEAESRAVLKMLPILDMIEDAQGHLKDSGLAIVIGEFKKSLSDLDVEEIKAQPGDNFNPLEMEAIEVVLGGPEHKISEVIKTGWKIKNEAFIIRPAKVKVFGK
jgi:molecular chaperone GrpE (heat shock protein)